MDPIRVGDQLRDVFTVPTTLPDEPVLLQQMLRPEISAAATQRPQQVCIFSLAGDHEAAVGQHDIRFDKIVAGQSVLPAEVAVPPDVVRDTLGRIANRHPINRIDELKPWQASTSP
jgi:hypothetical protein